MRKRSKFSLSNYKLASMKFGYVVPVNLTEVLPGDSIQQSTSVFMRLAPMNAPVMHPVHMTTYHFYVPTRIIWDDFEDFITGGPDGTDLSAPPTISISPTAGTLADYLGLPLVTSPISISALPFRAYDLIWNEYFRDQDLMEEVPISLNSGVDTTTSTTLLKPCWTKDYFTTARPWPQKGPQVTVPVDTTAAGQPTLQATTTITPNGMPTFLSAGKVGPLRNDSNPSGSGISAPLYFTYPKGSIDSGDLTWSNPALAAQTQISYTPGAAGIGSVDINALRQGFALQRFQEKRALFGSRYEDYLRYIGVRPQDARLQLPEYLGGGSQTIQFSEVLQTGGENVGALYGHGISAMRTNRYRRFIPEHGFIMTLLVVRPIPVYTQGIERLWSRTTKDDYWQLEFEHIGQQEVLNQEVYADGTETDKQTFGYQNRYDEYRRGVNTVSGEFRTTLDYWHMARVFANRPALNADFVESNPTDRIFQLNEQNSDQLYCMVQNNIIAKRLVSKNGNPI